MRTWEQLRKEVLRDDSAAAAAYIRLALEENDLPALMQALRNVHAARGTLKGLGLRAAELQRVLDLLIAEQPRERAQKRRTGKAATARVLT
jgi:DNA-binding phage protein